MLKEKILNDMKEAMKAQDAAKLSAIRMLKSAIQYFEINKGGAGYEATDEDIVEVVGKEVKKRRESIELYEKGERPELAEKEKNEVDILQSYLPEQLSQEELEELVDEAVAQTGATEMKDMGKVMGALMPKIKGKAESSQVSTLVREKLS